MLLIGESARTYHQMSGEPVIWAAPTAIGAPWAHAVMAPSTPVARHISRLPLITGFSQSAPPLVQSTSTSIPAFLKNPWLWSPYTNRVVSQKPFWLPATFTLSAAAAEPTPSVPAASEADARMARTAGLIVDCMVFLLLKRWKS